MRILLLIGLVIIVVLSAAAALIESEKVEAVGVAATACAEGNQKACDVANKHQDIVSWTDDDGKVITLAPPTPTPPPTSP
jgi:hypothetical protein